MNTPIDFARRRLLGVVAAGATSMAVAPLRAARQPVAVLTSYPDEVVSHFRTGFEESHPQFRLEVIWRKSVDALPYLRQPKQGNTDVYWAASPRTYATLAKEGALRKLEIDRSGLPGRVGGTPLADPDGRYVATEMAAYGIAINPQAMARQRLPGASDWADLSDPRFAGHIAIPSPSKVGYAPPLLEIVLQAFGWKEGWALWSKLAGNASLFDHGANFVTQGVASGQYAAGVTIDFFAATAIAGGAPLQFVYPRQTGVHPGHIAITAGAPNPEGAAAFVAFVLSSAGQKILAHPDICKLPVRPAAYRELPPGQFDPFRAAEKGAFAYDNEDARPRMGLTTAIFEAFLAGPHDEMSALWMRVHRAEAAGRSVAPVRQLLCAPPITEAEANTANLQQSFRSRPEGRAIASLAQTQAAWQASCASNRRKAAALLHELVA